MLSDAFPPFSGEMKGAAATRLKICLFNPASQPQTRRLKILARDESRHSRAEEKSTLM